MHDPIHYRSTPVYHQVLQVGKAIDPVGLMGRTNPYYAGVYVIGRALGVRPLEEIPAEISSRISSRVEFETS